MCIDRLIKIRVYAFLYSSAFKNVYKCAQIMKKIIFQNLLQLFLKAIGKEALKLLQCYSVIYDMPIILVYTKIYNLQTLCNSVP